MGIDRHSIALFATAKRLGVRFDQTLMLGRQNLVVDGAGSIRAGFADAGEQIGRSTARTFLEDGYAEPLLRYLGAQTTDSLDASDYESSTHIHDLNDPLPEPLRRRYSFVHDGGTLEHIFNYPVGLSNALDAVASGGHFLAVTPTNGYSGHGFYQLSPELFYRVLVPQNGFQMKWMLLRDVRWGAHWYSVPDPATHGGRVMWSSSWPTLLYVLAERVNDERFSGPVIQSDYQAQTWNESLPGASRPAPSLKERAWRALPPAMQEIRSSISRWRRFHARLPRVSLTDLD